MSNSGATSFLHIYDIFAVHIPHLLRSWPRCLQIHSLARVSTDRSSVHRRGQRCEYTKCQFCGDWHGRWGWCAGWVTVSGSMRFMPAIALRRNPRDYFRHAATTWANHLTRTHSYSYTLRHPPQPPPTLALAAPLWWRVRMRVGIK